MTRHATVVAAVVVATGVIVGNGAARPAALAEAQQGRRQGIYPALQRPPGDPALIARGRGLYDLSCRACHGVDLRGGDLGGPNLLRSQLVLGDRQGELMWPVMRDGQSSSGGGSMPPQPLTEDDGRAVAEFIHSVLASASPQGGPPRGDRVELNVLVGDAVAGEAYFAATCASCHSASGDLRGIATRIADAKQLQNTWVRGGARAATRPPVMVTVSEPSGERVEGRLDRLDDFIVVLTTADGRHRSFSRRGGVPPVEVADPMARHRSLLPVYTDTDIHNVTAYLATLR